MHEPKRWDDSGLAKALKFWPLFMASVGVIYAVGQASTTINSVEKKIEKEALINDSQEERITRVEQNGVEVNRRLDRMENKIDAILKAVK